MKPLSEHMAFYTRYHRDPRNKATHYVGVPMIAFSILIPMGLLRVSMGGVDVSLAWVFAGVVLAYYLSRDLAIGLIACIVFVPVTWGADALARGPLAISLSVFAAAFVGGWILQLVGHVFEGRKPALVDNFFQVFVAPVFLIAQAMMALGLKKDLEAEVWRLVEAADMAENRATGDSEDGAAQPAE